MWSPDSEQIAVEKKGLRRQMLRLRNEISSGNRADWDFKLRERFLTLPEVNAAGWVYVYLSYGTEIDTWELAEELIRRGKRIAAPRVEGNEMTFYEISGMEDTVPGYKGIPEPAQSCRAVCEPKALMLMPGLAFTNKGDRMGYGGGFYDRFLHKEPDHRTIALAYPFQLLDRIPVEDFDHRIHTVVLPDDMIIQMTEAFP